MSSQVRRIDSALDALPRQGLHYQHHDKKVSFQGYREIQMVVGRIWILKTKPKMVGATGESIELNMFRVTQSYVHRVLE
jgi:hypothetical protein